MNSIIIISIVIAIAFVIICAIKYSIDHNSVELTPDSPFFNDEIDDAGADQIRFINEVV